MPELRINMAGQPPCGIMSHPGPVGRRVPLAEQGFGKPLGWFGDVLRREADCSPRRGDPVGLTVDEMGAEPPIEGGPVGPPELASVALGGGGGKGGGRASWGRDVRGSESARGTGDPQTAASAVDSNVDG